MTNDMYIPSDEEVRQSVFRVAERVFPRLRASRQRRWKRFGMAAAAIGLFFGGLGVGAAAYGATSPHVPPYADTPYVIYCYLGADDKVPAVQIGVNDRSVMGDPAASCRAQQKSTLQLAVIGDAISTYLTKGVAQCIALTSPSGEQSYFAWQASQDPTSHESIPFWVEDPGANGSVSYVGQSSKPAGFPASCLSVPVAATVAPADRFASCAIDSKSAAVYALTAGSAAAICKAHHYSTWK